VARGKSVPVELNVGIGMVMCVVAKPFPLEGEIDPDSTSIGERLWILNGAGPAPDFSKEQKKHIHLYNFHKKEDLETKEIAYKVATKSGYMIEVTGRSNTVKETRENLIKYIDNNVYLPGQKYRKEIGKRVEEMPAGILN
jgi:DNA/RNA endonuclease YhcR with UshA esterase domain